MPSHTATLELEREDENTHRGCITSVDISPDGSKCVSASYCDHTIKIWDANPRPFNASEWEEVDISGMEKDYFGIMVTIEGLGRIKSNFLKNTVTGALRKKYSTAGELLALESIQVWDAGKVAPTSPSLTKADHPCPLCRHARAQSDKGGCDVRHLGGLQSGGRQDHRVQLLEYDPSLGCRCAQLPHLLHLKQI